MFRWSMTKSQDFPSVFYLTVLHIWECSCGKAFLFSGIHSSGRCSVGQIQDVRTLGCLALRLRYQCHWMVWGYLGQLPDLKNWEKDECEFLVLVNGIGLETTKKISVHCMTLPWQIFGPVLGQMNYVMLPVKKKKILKLFSVMISLTTMKLFACSIKYSF